MKTNKTLVDLEEKYSILFHLPKKCACALCTTTKEDIKSEMGEKRFVKVCKTLGIL
ncbi:MAG: hypothetical protein RBT59_12935 [Arcobacteraceae bacterium]|jgi:hypothetical protein|nr:hypothetical protein [Arcobacteraceae bacterium]